MVRDVYTGAGTWVPWAMRYLIPKVITANLSAAANAMAKYLLNLWRYPDTRASVTFHAMMTGTAGANLIIPVRRAIHGVKTPTIAPLTGPIYIDATYKIALMPGPVIGWRRLRAWKAIATPAMTAVLTTVRRSMFNMVTPSPPCLG